MALVIKDPDARVDYVMDWGADYLDGQMIVASEWSVSPAAMLGIVIHGQSHDLLRAVVTVSGGVPGQIYGLRNRVTLSDGQIDERSIVIRVEAQ
jgi:hypothetical protein